MDTGKPLVEEMSEDYSDVTVKYLLDKMKKIQRLLRSHRVRQRYLALRQINAKKPEASLSMWELQKKRLLH